VGSASTAAFVKSSPAVGSGGLVARPELERFEVDDGAEYHAGAVANGVHGGRAVATPRDGADRVDQTIEGFQGRGDAWRSAGAVVLRDRANVEGPRSSEGRMGAAGAAGRAKQGTLEPALDIDRE
jgi:hypothetical protein